MAWLFPRLRAGAAAAMSGALGLAVLIGGATTSGSAVLAGRVSPGTVLGVAATASGALLMALAGRILVRSRRREGGRVWRWVRRVGWSGVAVVLAVIVSVGVEVGLAGPAEDVRVTSLSPWPRGSRTSTPYPCRASILARQAPSPTREHDHCRAVGRRNVGGGEPEPVGGPEHDHRLSAVVSEGAGSRSMAEDVHMRTPDMFLGLPFSVVSTLSTAVFSDSMPPPALHDLVADIAPRSIMLIWTRRGNGETYFDPDYYERAGEPKAIWEIPESTHIGGLAARPAEYERRVIAFFDEALNVAEVNGDGRS